MCEGLKYPVWPDNAAQGLVCLYIMFLLGVVQVMLVLHTELWVGFNEHLILAVFS